MKKARALRKGDKVAIVSLSRGVLGEDFARHQLALGQERLRAMGLEPVVMPNALKGIDFLNKYPQKRAEDLKLAFLDDAIKGIICSIGGFDTYRLAPYLLDDAEFVEAVARQPKLFTGYSDTTVNHMMFYQLGMVSFYGLNFMNDLAELGPEMLPYTREAFERYFGGDATYVIESSPVWYEERRDFSEAALGTWRVAHEETHGYEVLRGSGRVQGALLGGCLESLYELLVGGRFEDQLTISERYGLFPGVDEWKDKLFFFETSEEKPDPERFGMMLRKLKEVGVFDQVRGLIVGKPQDEAFYEAYKSVLLEVTAEEDLPILYNVNFGHAYPHAMLPYGVQAVMDLEEKRIEVVEGMFEER